MIIETELEYRAFGALNHALEIADTEEGFLTDIITAVNDAMYEYDKDYGINGSPAKHELDFMKEMFNNAKNN